MADHRVLPAARDASKCRRQTALPWPTRCAVAALLLLPCLQAHVAIAAPPPTASALPAVTLDSRRSLGSVRAPVGIVEFSDLQCPFCRRFQEGTLRELKARYIDTGKVRFCFRDYPLEGREQALSAAVAARCAGHQGAFWPMLDVLFARQAELGRALYPSLARELKLDSTRFRACLASAQEAALVHADVHRGQTLQVDSTPQFFIGKLSGSRLTSPTSLVGAQPIESFQKIIEHLLRP